jgi:hypothetical protein
MSFLTTFLSEAEESAKRADLTDLGAPEAYAVKIALIDGTVIVGHVAVRDDDDVCSVWPLIWPKLRGRRVENAEISEYPYHVRLEAILWARYYDTDDDAWDN